MRTLGAGWSWKILLLGLLLFAAAPMRAQDVEDDDLEDFDEDKPRAGASSAKRGEVDTEPYLNEVQVLGGTLFLGFDLPYDGVVEIKLINDQGKVVFHNHFVKKIGVNHIRLTPKLEAEERRTYYYYFQYKGHVLEGQFRYP